MAAGMADAFRSPETPPFPEMIAKLFSQADPRQRDGILDILDRAAPQDLREEWLGPGRAGGRSSDGVSPEAIHQLAARIQTDQPGVMDDIGRFLSGHPDLFRSLGGGVLAHILGGAARRLGGQGQTRESEVRPASEDPYGDPAGQQVRPASEDPYGDPADQNVRPVSEDPYRDPADQNVRPASEDPYGDPADQSVRSS